METAGRARGTEALPEAGGDAKRLRLAAGAPMERTSSLRREGTIFLERMQSERSKQECRIHNDYVHGAIEMGPLESRIIDTPQFQRLDALSQLGTAKYVYRGAKHTRFEHSLGVAHLAEQMVRSLRTNCPQLNVDARDALCVKVAALCHDLGHGPYSHLYDDVIVPSAFPGKLVDLEGTGEKVRWSHELASILLWRHMLRENAICLEDYGLLPEDSAFIEELINPPPPALRAGRRDPAKHFLYDIVNNTASGLDVDKLDYFARDAQRVGAQTAAPSYGRIFAHARVCSVEKDGVRTTRVCYPEKMVLELLHCFRTRFDLHKTVYQHKTVKQIEFMIRDALLASQEAFTVAGRPRPGFEDGRYGIAEAVFDMAAYANLKDSILDQIESSDDERLGAAKAIIDRLRRRDLYRFVAECDAPDALWAMDEAQIKEGILRHHRRAQQDAERERSPLKSPFKAPPPPPPPLSPVRLALGAPAGLVDEASQQTLPDLEARSPARAPRGAGAGAGALGAEELIVERKRVHWGKKARNPVADIYFFAKHRPQRGFRIEEKHYATILPRTFEERKIRIFVKHRDHVAHARIAFRMWTAAMEVCESSPHSPREPPGGGGGGA